MMQKHVPGCLSQPSPSNGHAGTTSLPHIGGPDAFAPLISLTSAFHPDRHRNPAQS